MRHASLIILVLLAGCAKKSEKEPAADKAAAPLAAVAAPATPKAPEPKTTGPILTLGDRLVAEQSNRPLGTPKAEEVYATFEKLGVKITEKKQHVARLYGAMFCLGAKTDAEVHYSVCEYETPEAATQGKDASRKALASVPNRELATNKKTLLTIRQPGAKTAETEALAKRSFEAFARL